MCALLVDVCDYVRCRLSGRKQVNGKKDRKKGDVGDVLMYWPADVGCRACIRLSA